LAQCATWRSVNFSSNCRTFSRGNFLCFVAAKSVRSVCLCPSVTGIICLGALLSHFPQGFLPQQDGALPRYRRDVHSFRNDAIRGSWWSSVLGPTTPYTCQLLRIRLAEP
jgi:hypothetical protein